MLIGVDFCNGNFISSVREGGSELLIDGSKVLAVTAPRSKEFNERRFGGGEDNLVEVGRDKIEDRRAGGGGGSGSDGAEREEGNEGERWEPHGVSLC